MPPRAQAAALPRSRSAVRACSRVARGVFRTAGTANSLPTPILLALIAMALLAAGGGLVALGRRFPEVIGAASRIFRR